MSIPSQFQEFTINYYNGQDPYQNGQLTAAGGVLLSQFATMLASIPESQKQTPDQLNALYLQFLAQKTMDIRISEESNALSPEEISQRHLVYSVYDILLTLLNTVTTNEIATSAVLNFLSQKEKTYTDMMAKTTMYIGTGTIYTQGDSRKVSPSYPASTADATQTQIHSSATDATQFTLGYMNISVDDISQYLTDQVFRQNQSTSSFDIYSDAWPISSPSLLDLEDRNHATMTITNNGNGTCTATATFTQEGHNMETGGWDTLNSYNVSSGPIPISTTTFAQAQGAMDSAFLTVYAWAKLNNMVEISTAQLTSDEQKGSDIEQAYDIAKRNIKIPWGTSELTPDTLKNPDVRPVGILAYKLSPDTTDQTWLAALNNLQQARDQYNKTLNTYIGQAEAEQQLIGDKSSQQQQVVQAATSSREMTNKILKSAIQQMATIIQAIFK